MKIKVKKKREITKKKELQMANEEESHSSIYINESDSEHDRPDDDGKVNEFAQVSFHYFQLNNWYRQKAVTIVKSK